MIRGNNRPLKISIKWGLFQKEDEWQNKCLWFVFWLFLFYVCYVPIIYFLLFYSFCTNLFSLIYSPWAGMHHHGGLYLHPWHAGIFSQNAEATNVCLVLSSCLVSLQVPFSFELGTILMKINSQKHVCTVCCLDFILLAGCTIIPFLVNYNYKITEWGF